MILLLVAFIFIASNALVNVGSSRRYNGLLQDYQQVNGLLAINNRRQTYFKLYSKSHDEGCLSSTTTSASCLTASCGDWMRRCEMTGSAR